MGTATTNEPLIAEAGRRLAKAAPDARVILFGSHARGEAGPGSDLDLLVIEARSDTPRRKEFVRLRRALGDLGVPVDLLVLTEDHVAVWERVPGTTVHRAMAEGRVLVGR